MSLPPRSRDAACFLFLTLVNAIFAYQHDAWERTVLFCHTLRRRGDHVLERERAEIRCP